MEKVAIAESEMQKNSSRVVQRCVRKLTAHQLKDPKVQERISGIVTRNLERRGFSVEGVRVKIVL
jgi:hypothetical protein